MSGFIKVEGIEKSVSDFQLGPINVDIEPGTVTAIVGENGSGKSTLLKTMMNIYKSDAGAVTFFGENVATSDQWKEQVAYQGQQTYGYDLFTLQEMRTFIGKWYPNFDEALFQEMVERLRIPMNKKYTQMSEGMQQKMVLALTIPRNTHVLILDEPTAFMDIPAKNYVMQLLVDWLEDGEGSLILASHQADDIRKLADYLLFVKDGKQLEWVEKETLLERYVRYTFTGGIPLERLPGEVSRSEARQEIIVQILDAEIETKIMSVFEAAQIKPLSESRLDLEEVITLLFE